MANFNELFGQSFNAQEQASNNSFDVIPAGWYPVQVEDVSEKDTKSGGKMLKVMFCIVGEQCNGRKLFTHFNVRNASAKAVEIAMRELGILCVACGIPNAASTDQLIGGVCEAQVIVKNHPDYGDQNEIKKYRSISGSARKPAAPASAPVAQSKTTQDLPWRAQ